MTRRLIPILAVTFVALRATPVTAIKHGSGRAVTGHPEAVLIAARNAHAHQALTGCGVLITPRAVLTAAHCAANFDAWEVAAPHGKPPRSRVREARVHPKYQPGRKEYDLAVLILDEPIDTGKELPDLHGDDLLPIETKLAVVGRDMKAKPRAAELFQATVTLVADRTNANVYGGVPRVCEPGDSGGPVYVAGKGSVVVAIVGGVMEESRANVPTDIYVPITRASREWILRQVPKPD